MASPDILEWTDAVTVREQAPSTTAARDQGTTAPKASLEHRKIGPSRASIPIDVLYPALPGSTSDVVRAISELATVIETLGSAKQLAEVDIERSDRLCINVQMALPSLFACRKGIGDGYANVINSLHFAFVNRRGIPFDAQQLSAIWRVLRGLRNRPFASFDQSLLYVAELEEAGLKVDPPSLARLIDDEPDAD
jgi:hypothetical protein